MDPVSAMDRAAVLDFQIKELKKELDPLKELLADWYLEEGKASGCKKFDTDKTDVAFSETLVYGPIDTMALYERLKEIGKGGDIWHVLKPDLAAVKKVLGADDIKALQGSSTGVKVAVRLKLKGV